MPNQPSATQAANTTPSATQANVASKRAQMKGRKTVAKNTAQLERLNVSYVPVDSIVPNSWNPNRQSEHDFELLLRSMEEDGFTQPVICLREGNVIVDGEHRWRAGRVLGYEEIPVVFVDMTPEQARISTIRHNRARGSHDVNLEAELLRDLDKLGALSWAQDSLMLDDVEINRLLSDMSAPEALASEEYSEAWIPSKFTEEQTAVIRGGGQTTERNTVRDEKTGTEHTTAMTVGAIEQMRERERLIADAQTEQEKQVAMREQQVYRVSYTFAGEEAEVIRHVLGNHPAEKLVELCKAERLRLSQ